MANLNTLAAIAREGLKTVGCTFPNSDKVYTYKTMDKYEVGDMAVVYNQRSESFKVVDVVEVHDSPQIDATSSIEYQWLVQRVDMTKYNELVDRDIEVTEHLRKRQLESYRKQAQETLMEQAGISREELSQLFQSKQGE